VGLARSFQAAVLALAVVPVLAGAEPIAPPASPSPAAPPLPVTAPPTRVSPVRLAGTLGFDVGFTNLLKAKMTDTISVPVTFTIAP
jgi:hypothetical protein